MASTLKQFIYIIKTQTGIIIGCFQLNKAAEWLSKDLTNFFKNKGIFIKVSTPYTAHQNGIVEKANHLVKKRVGVILIKT